MSELISLFQRYDLALTFVVVFAARLGLPLPASPFLVVAGGLLAAQLIPLAAAFVAATIACLFGDLFWYWAGRRYGHRVLGLLCRISQSPDACVRQSELSFARWRGRALVLAKFVPGISLMAPPMAGAIGRTAGRAAGRAADRSAGAEALSVKQFLVYDAFASALWAALFLLLGFVFSNQIEQVLAVLANMGAAALAVLIVVLTVYIGWRIVRRQLFLNEIAMTRISPEDLQLMMQHPPAPLVIDVRSESALRADPRMIPSAVAIDLARLEASARRLPKGRAIVVYCNCPNEASAARAARVLNKHGFRDVWPLRGGLDGWTAAGFLLDKARNVVTEKEAEQAAAARSTARGAARSSVPGARVTAGRGVTRP